MTKSSTKNKNSNKIKYVVAIPSYKRHLSITDKTLRVLEEYKIPPSIIYVFVANKTEEKLYRGQFTSPYLKKISIIVGKKGLKNQRNFISKYFPPNTNLVQMDDDIKGICKMGNYNKSARNENTLSKLRNLDVLIKKGFSVCREKGVFLWGVYPLCNAYFMFPRVTEDLRFITGPFFGMINRHSPKLRLTLDEKEDSQRTLQHFVMDGGVIRFNDVSIHTSYYKNKGGMQDEGKDRKKEAMKSAMYLIKKYPELTKLNVSKKSGVPEVKLIN